MFFIILSLFLMFLSGTYSQDIAEKQCERYVNEIQGYQEEEPNPIIFTRFSDLIGGSISAASEFPFMAALGYGDNDNIQWECGGSLISEKFVLTAAHCAYHRGLGRIKLVRIGTTDLTLDIGQKPAQDIAVKSIQIHPQYAPPSVYNDIALVELETVLQFSSSLRPACLHTDSRFIDVPVIALGWGRLEFAGDRSSDLMKVTISISPPEVCRRKYTSQLKLRKGINTSIQICAGGGPKNTCQGDSGGPIVMQKGNNSIIVGITSFGEPCGLSNTPGVYTRISTFVPWLERLVWK